METENKIKEEHRGGRAFGGLIVVGVGVILLLKQMGTFLFPQWLFTWQMLLIVLGLFIGVRHGFRSWGGWLIMMLVGGIFLVKDYFPQYELSDYIWPIAIIIVGIFIMLRPKRHHGWERYHHYGHHHREKWEKWQKWQTAQTVPPSGEDYIDSVSIFAETNKVVVSKNFKGGDIVNIFGGCNLDLTQADFTGTITLDVTQIFGGAKIIVPSNWKIITKMTSVFGGLEDKRPPALLKEDPEKTLIIEGTSVFAGISLQCY